MGIANQLTLVRLGLSPVFVVAFYFGGLAGHLAALIIAGIFELTDIFDGYLARTMRETSDFGKLLDPMADSVSRFSVFLCLLWGGYAHLWVVALIFYRDSLVAYMRVASAKAGVVLAARLSGKVKAIVQGIIIIVILALIVGSHFIRELPVERTREVARWLMLLVAAVTAWSGFDYARASVPIIRNLMHKS